MNAELNPGKPLQDKSLDDDEPTPLMPPTPEKPPKLGNQLIDSKEGKQKLEEIERLIKEKEAKLEESNFQLEEARASTET